MTPLLHRCEKHIAEIVRRKGHMIKFMTSSICFYLFRLGYSQCNFCPHITSWNEIEEIQFSDNKTLSSTLHPTLQNKGKLLIRADASDITKGVSQCS